MKKIMLSIWMIFTANLCGCTVYTGLAAHLEKHDDPEFNGNNPLGIIGAEYDYGRFRGFCEHQSSIPDWEVGYGFNECGVIVKINP